MRGTALALYHLEQKFFVVSKAYKTALRRALDAEQGRESLRQGQANAVANLSEMRKKLEAAESRVRELEAEVERLKTVSVANLGGAIETDKELEDAESTIRSLREELADARKFYSPPPCPECEKKERHIERLQKIIDEAY